MIIIKMTIIIIIIIIETIITIIEISFLRSYAKNFVFDVQKRGLKLPELGGLENP